jgi:signal transduction histidine kinase
VRLDRSNRAPCKFEQIAAESMDLCQPDLDRARVTVRTVIAVDLPRIMVDLLQIEQVLINLLRNAIEAITGSGALQGTVSIEAKVRDPDFIEVRVADSGPGFSPPLLENAFLPLSTTKAEGLGIGLPLCRTIVEAHGGKLWVDEAASGGAVRLTLPVAKS